MGDATHRYVECVFQDAKFLKVNVLLDWHYYTHYPVIIGTTEISRKRVTRNERETREKSENTALASDAGSV